MERQTQVNIRLHLEEKAQILKRAKEEKLSLSDFMRRAALKGLVPKTKAGVQSKQETMRAAAIAREVREAGPPGSEDDSRLTKLIKQLTAQGRPDPETEARVRLGL